MKKHFSVFAASALCAVCTVGSASAAVDAGALNDGVYNVDVESDSSMFKVVNCDVTAANGKMTAAVTLSGTGYSKLFVGTGEQAAAAAESEHITFTESADGKYVYTLPLSSLDVEIDVAAWSTKKSEWYSRKLTFKSDKLPESAYKAASGTPGDSDDQSDILLIAPAPSGDGSENPNTGAFGMLGVSVAAAAAAVVFSRKKH
ncbi:MAG: NPXTG-anchored protein [Oscillospiraceae bacterium]|nr:NPXTG-anchored protein [Oscillospiraceae bacterium]